MHNYPIIEFLLYLYAGPDTLQLNFGPELDNPV